MLMCDWDGMGCYCSVRFEFDKYVLCDVLMMWDVLVVDGMVGLLY